MGVEFEGTNMRYVDNFDYVTSLAVLVQKTDKRDIKDFGSPHGALEKFGYLLGQQSIKLDSLSEGGFERGTVSSASVLDISSKVVDGTTYYQYNILTRTADGDEGGRHQLVTAAVNKDNGLLYTLKIQAGDKRWFKGTDKECLGAYDSFRLKAPFA